MSERDRHDKELEEALRDPEVRRAFEGIKGDRMVLDRHFDRVYPPAIRDVSSRFWTPVVVARRAARLLAPDPSTRVLDLGAGAGKFCIVGAIATGASFTGIEHRLALVESGERVVARLGLEGVHLVHGSLEDLDFRDYDAFYLYNPFEENIFGPEKQLDQSVPLSATRLRRDVALVERALDEAPVGTRVVTFHGFGGEMPESYELRSAETRGTAFLRLWVKTG